MKWRRPSLLRSGARFALTINDIIRREPQVDRRAIASCSVRATRMVCERWSGAVAVRSGSRDTKIDPYSKRWRSRPEPTHCPGRNRGFAPACRAARGTADSDLWSFPSKQFWRGHHGRRLSHGANLRLGTGVFDKQTGLRLQVFCEFAAAHVALDGGHHGVIHRSLPTPRTTSVARSFSP